MATALETQQQQIGTYDELAFIERFSLLVDHEHLTREQRKQTRLIHQARFKLNATLSEIDYQPARNLQKSQLARLTQHDWIARGQNLLITGPCGCGKTYLACVLGHHACCRDSACATSAYRGYCSNLPKPKPTAVTVNCEPNWPSCNSNPRRLGPGGAYRRSPQ